MPDPRRITVIAPHPDDESIGCGGAICRYVDSGDLVTVVYLTSGELGLKHLDHCEAWRIREAEARDAQKVLGYAEATFLRQPDWTVSDDIVGAAAALRPVLLRDTPDILYLPHPGEWHPDHQASLPVVLEALQGAPIAPLLRLYEVWTPLGEHDHVEDIGPVIVRKMRAIRCYRSQLRGFRYDRASRGLSQYRGAIAARCAYAEVFQTREAAP